MTVKLGNDIFETLSFHTGISAAVLLLCPALFLFFGAEFPEICKHPLALLTASVLLDYTKVLAHGDPTTQTCRRLDSVLEKLRDHARRPDSVTFPPEKYKLMHIIRLEPRQAKHE